MNPINLDAVIEAVREDNCVGFCTECGADQAGVEPDAEGYRCGSCGALAVKGAELILMEMGL